MGRLLPWPLAPRSFSEAGEAEILKIKVRGKGLRNYAMVSRVTSEPLLPGKKAAREQAHMQAVPGVLMEAWGGDPLTKSQILRGTWRKGAEPLHLGMGCACVPRLRRLRDIR